MRAPLLALIASPLLLLSLGDADATVCGQGPASQPLPVRTTAVPPLVRGLAGRPASIATPHPLLATSRDESLALDVVLLRLRLENCVQDQYAGYKPRTQYDNTPWRYNMEKGKKFTAAEFDAWMRSRGVRVAKGRADPAAPAAAAAAGTAETVSE